SIVIPLLPDPNLSKQWPDQHMLDITRRILCGIDDNGQHYYDQRSAIAAVASVAIVCETRTTFDFASGVEHARSYPSAIGDVLKHLWKYRVTFKGDANPERKPLPKEYRRMLRWMYHHLRPHHEKMINFLNTQNNLINA